MNRIYFKKHTDWGNCHSFNGYLCSRHCSNSFVKFFFVCVTFRCWPLLWVVILQQPPGVIIIRQWLSIFLKLLGLLEIFVWIKMFCRPLLWEVILRQPPSVVAGLAQSEATKSRKQGNLLQGRPHHITPQYFTTVQWYIPHFMPWHHSEYDNQHHIWVVVYYR